MPSSSSPPPPFTAFAGVDWGNFSHEVCLLAAAKPLRKTFSHSPAGLRELVAWLLRQCPAADLAVAIEVPHGPVVEALQDASIAVHAINPKQLDRFRDRFSVAGAKDDRLDALVLATSLRTDFERFTRVPSPDPKFAELRAASRLGEALTHDLHDHTNRLWQTLMRSAPQLLAFSKGANDPWFWDLCERVFAPGRLPTRPWVQALLRRYRKKLSADEVLAVLRSPGLVLPASAAVAPLEVAALVPILRAIHSQREIVRARLKELLAAAGETAAIIDSQPGLDVILTAVILAEAGDAVKRADKDALRALSGVAPVTKRSGKSHQVVFRRACNLRLRSALRNWAHIAVRCEPRSKVHYTKLRGSGHSHEHALRAIADTLISRLVACLRAGVHYDPMLWNPPVEAPSP